VKQPTDMNWDDRLEEADKASVAKFNACAARLSGLRLDEVKHSGQLRSRAAWNLAAHQQGLLYRIVSLIDGIAVAWNNRTTLSAYLSARALLETIAAMAEYESSISSFLANKDIDGLDAFAQKGILSSRDSEVVSQAPEVKAKNVLNYVNKLDKGTPGFRKYYDDLSERCHPNALGHTYMFSRLDLSAETYRFSDERDPDKTEL
jgi:hypothetical protein